MVSFKVTQIVDGVVVQPEYVCFNLGIADVTYNTSGSANVVAAENLGGHRVVTVEGFYASKDTATDKFKILGITTGAVSLGASATITTFGTVTESSWNWTVGNPVFLSTNGLLTQTAPTTGFRTIIGIPQSATSMFVDISEPITII